MGLDALETWLKPVANGQQSILFIDEANLEKEGSWDILEGLFNKTPGIFHNKKFYPLSPNHKIIFAGNYSNFVGRHNHDFFERHGNIFNFKELPDSALANKNILPGLDAIVTLTPEDKVKITDIFLKIYHQLNKELPDHPLTARNLKLMAGRFHLLFNDTKDDIEVMAHMAAIDEVSGLLTNRQRHQYKSTLQKLDTLDKGMPDKVGNFVVTTSRRPILRLLNQQLALRDLKYDVSQILLEGPPGVGKSLLAIENLISKGFVNGLSPESQQVESTKRYYHLTPTDPEKMTAILLKAFHEGAVVIIDEFNSIVLERTLNALLSGYDLEGNKAKVPGFFIMATQNPISFAGRQSLSTALENRSRKIEVPDFNEDENKSICLNICPHPAIVNTLLQTYNEAKRYAQYFKKIPAPTPRDLFHKVSFENRKIVDAENLKQAYLKAFERILHDFKFFNNNLAMYGIFGGKSTKVLGQKTSVPHTIAKMIDIYHRNDLEPLTKCEEIIALARTAREKPVSNSTFSFNPRQPAISALYDMIANIDLKVMSWENSAKIHENFALIKNPEAGSVSSQNNMAIRPK